NVTRKQAEIDTSGVLCTALLFIPVSRGSAILKVAGLSFKESIRYHIWLGHTAMAVFTIHGLLYVIIWASNNNLHEHDHVPCRCWYGRGWTSNVAGELSWLCGLSLWVTPLPYIRRKMFELFFYTHQLYVLFVFFYVLHVCASHFYMFLPRLYLLMVDRFLCFLQSQQPVRLLCTRVLPCHVVELTFSKRLGLHYNPMSTVFINIPSISTLQWHPFSVTSDSSLEEVEPTVFIKSEGSWSKLSIKSYRPKMLQSIDLKSQLKDLMFVIFLLRGRKHQGCFSFVRSRAQWNFTCLISYSLFPLLLQKFSSLELQVEAYVTREKEPQTAQIEAQTIWFKPSQSDALVSWAVGSNCNWLWRGAVILASFSLFLVIFGVLTRFYTYPRESKSQSHYQYPTWLRAFFMMLFMFMSIVLVSTVATISIRRKEAKEGGQIQNLEMQTPTRTPRQLTYKAKKELERFPHQSVVQSTNVQYTYGARPDFRSKTTLLQFLSFLCFYSHNFVLLFLEILA
ncbi:Ferric reduction oxidase 4, partial [Nymphaea thermarum]